MQNQSKTSQNNELISSLSNELSFRITTIDLDGIEDSLPLMLAFYSEQIKKGRLFNGTCLADTEWYRPILPTSFITESNM